MLFVHHRSCRSFHLVVIVFLGLFAVPSSKVLADTNLLTTASWVVDGTDDTGTNASDITMSVNGHAVGAFSELSVSYNVGDTGVVAVGTIKGSGEIRMALPPPGVFGGSFYTTGYWDCDAGFVPGLSITELNVLERGGRVKELVFKGKASNLISMAAKDFTITMYPPTLDSFRANVTYTLIATTNFCIDQVTHTNQDDFEVVRMASNYVSTNVNENDETRYIKQTAHDCYVYFCTTRTKSYCNTLTNADGFVIDDPPRLGQSVVNFVHSQDFPGETPTLSVRLTTPPSGRIRPQCYLTPSTDPTAQNVSFWGNWIDARPKYRNRQRVGRFGYTLEVDSPQAVPCDYTD
jgi:hypothetical protein